MHTIDYSEADATDWNEEESIDTSNRGFPKACPPSSLAVQQTHLERKGKRLSLSKPKSMFIDDWKASMDVCNNLHLLENHGSFAGRRAAHSPLEPIFSMAKTSTHSDILTIPMDFWSLDSPHTAWENKTDDRLFWRGKTTGNAYSTKSDWKKEHRFRLVSMAEEGKLVTRDDKGEEVVQQVDKSWLDMGFVGQASRKRTLYQVYTVPADAPQNVTRPTERAKRFTSDTHGSPEAVSTLRGISMS